MHEFVGHPTEQPLTQGQMTISTHNDEVGLAPFGLRHQLGCDFFAAALDAMQRGVDRVMPEMIDGVDAEDGLFFGRVLAGHDHDRNLIREALGALLLSGALAGDRAPAGGGRPHRLGRSPAERARLFRG